MNAVYEIPLAPGSHQQFSVTLANVSYNMRLIYHSANAGLSGVPAGVNGAAGGFVDGNDLDDWSLDIYDSGNSPIVTGIPLIPGIDLLYQYRYLGIGGSLAVVVDGAPASRPSFSGLGATGHIYFVVGR